jgi:hypothetical protein
LPPEEEEASLRLADVVEVLLLDPSGKRADWALAPVNSLSVSMMEMVLRAGLPVCDWAGGRKHRADCCCCMCCCCCSWEDATEEEDVRSLRSDKEEEAVS